MGKAIGHVFGYLEFNAGEEDGKEMQISEFLSRNIALDNKWSA